ncbi:MAG TPA: fibronectin type III domain-containing protein [Candidatus Angelobacter sp.]|nr:fibronectin type III domain-containing protein [Candidatus Angelobacter sp.]
MSSSTWTTAAQGKNCVQATSVRNLFCLLMILMLAVVTASAQTIVTPNTTTVQYLGVPNPQGTTDAAVTAPLGGIILKGTALSPATGQPVRHLWVDDATSGLCRIDPDLDTPGPYAINIQTCPFKINGASVTGGPLSFDPTPRFLDPANPTIATSYLYFADEQRASQGIMRIGYLATGDSGQGSLNFNSLFIMAGNTTGARFGGGTTGCAIAGNPGLPHATVLDPLGNLWVGFKKSGSIVRFNQPGTASETGFGTCDQFITPVATVNKISNGLAFIGHDLWGADGTSPFFVKNADTLCAVPPHGLCTVASGDVVNTLVAAVGAAPTAAMSDQYYPATNGNNVYFTLSPAGGPFNTAWLGNASTATAASMAATTLDTTFYGTFSPVGDPNPAIANINGLAVDPSDPANVVLYSADDYSGLGTLAKGMWFQTCQGVPAVPAPAPAPSPYMLNCPTPIATAAPGAPLNVFGVASNSAVSVNWSPAQSNQPVTSYTVTTITAGPAVAPVTVVPVAGSNFPPTSVLISGLVNGTSYSFTVTATNAAGTSPSSAASASVTPPGVAVPAAPTNATAIPGDTQAAVTFTVSPPPQGAPVTGYAVTSNPGGIVVNIPPPASGNTATALVGGLTNGVSYTFTVQAVDIAGSSAPSAPSNTVTPSAAHVPGLTTAISGPSSVSTTPTQVTYTISVTNPITPTSAFPANVSVTHTLSPVRAVIAAGGASRNSATGVVTITLTSPHALSIGQSITIAGVSDASFNGTFTIQDVPSATTLTYAQAGATATSGSGTVTGLPLANIVLAQTSQGTCTSGGAGVITVTCNQGSLAAGASTTMTVIVQIQSQAILNSVVASGTDAAGTALANANASITTTVPLPSVSTISAPVSVTGNPQNPNPNVGQAGNITWTVSNVSTTATPNVQLAIFVPTGLNINAPNPPTPTFDNGGTGSCTAASPVAGGNQFICTTATLGGSKKNGVKPVSTMTVIINVTPAAGTSKAVFHPTETVTFGPGGTDTLPNVASLTITVR